MPKALRDVKFPFFWLIKLMFLLLLLLLLLFIIYFLFNLLFELNLHHTKRIHITTSRDKHKNS